MGRLMKRKSSLAPVARFTKVCIVGLGRVGLPLAILCAKKGHCTVGIDKNRKIVRRVNRGISPIKDETLEAELKNTKIFATHEYEQVGDSEVILICVPTPVDKRHKPNLKFLESALRCISEHMQKNQLVIIESTVSPGTTEKVVAPLLERSGLKAGHDFHLAHAPERIDPGDKEWPLEKIPRVVGGVTRVCSKKAAEFYRRILDASVLELESVSAVEATKILENAFRDVNIAFANEMAKSFDKVGIDILEVIRAASTKPFGFLPHYPGCGVGGHCIPVDPYYLIEKAKLIGFEHRFLALARKINDSMPRYTIQLLRNELKNLGTPLKGAKVGILGVAYKGNVDDTRESPSLRIITLLRKAGAEVHIYDPLVPEESNTNGLDEILKKADYLVLAADHDLFKKMNLEKLRDNKIKLVVDGKNCLSKKKIEGLGIRYKGIGR